MKNKNKILVIVLIILILFSIALLVLVFTNKKEEDITYKDDNLLINKDVIENIEVNNILFSNIKYKYDNEETNMIFDITNNMDEALTIGHFIINVYDKDNNLINSFHPVYNRELQKEETITNFSVSIPLDLSNGYKIAIELPELNKEKE